MTFYYHTFVSWLVSMKNLYATRQVARARELTASLLAEMPCPSCAVVTPLEPDGDGYAFQACCEEQEARIRLLIRKVTNAVVASTLPELAALDVEQRYRYWRTVIAVSYRSPPLH